MIEDDFDADMDDNPKFYSPKEALKRLVEARPILNSRGELQAGVAGGAPDTDIALSMIDRAGVELEMTARALSSASEANIDKIRCAAILRNNTMKGLSDGFQTVIKAANPGGGVKADDEAKNMGASAKRFLVVAGTYASKGVAYTHELCRRAREPVLQYTYVKDPKKTNERGFASYYRTKEKVKAELHCHTGALYEDCGITFGAALAMNGFLGTDMWKIDADCLAVWTEVHAASINAEMMGLGLPLRLPDNLVDLEESVLTENRRSVFSWVIEQFAMVALGMVRMNADNLLTALENAKLCWGDPTAVAGRNQAGRADAVAKAEAWIAETREQLLLGNTVIWGTLLMRQCLEHRLSRLQCAGTCKHLLDVFWNLLGTLTGWLNWVIDVQGITIELPVWRQKKLIISGVLGAMIKFVYLHNKVGSRDFQRLMRSATQTRIPIGTLPEILTVSATRILGDEMVKHYFGGMHEVGGPSPVIGAFIGLRVQGVAIQQPIPPSGFVKAGALAEVSELKSGEWAKWDVKPAQDNSEAFGAAQAVDLSLGMAPSGSTGAH